MMNNNITQSGIYYYIYKVYARDISRVMFLLPTASLSCSARGCVMQLCISSACHALCHSATVVDILSRDCHNTKVPTETNPSHTVAYAASLPRRPCTRLDSHLQCRTRRHNHHHRCTYCNGAGSQGNRNGTQGARYWQRQRIMNSRQSGEPSIYIRSRYKTLREEERKRHEQSAAAAYYIVPCRYT